MVMKYWLMKSYYRQLKTIVKLNPWLLEGASKGSSVLTGSMFLLV
jgi:hypothetical protein